MKKIILLGSTGSIGTQTLDVLDRNNGKFSVELLTGNKNADLLEKQIRKYNPKFAAISDEKSYYDLKNKIKDTNTKLYGGADGIAEAVELSEADIAVSAIMGVAGLIPTYCAIKKGMDIALANKETLVTAGKLITELCKKNNVKLLPVDSEHSAVFQCLNALEDKKFLKKIILTASGGPFYGKTLNELKNVTPSDALKHPNWSMGRKITIDSATMMNKGLEIIEAKWLFDVDICDIDVLIHRESIVHSMVQFSDNSVLAQMGLPDMRGPISYALNFPEREFVSGEIELDLSDIGNLTFGSPDYETFKCLRLAKSAINFGGTMPCYLNGANEAAVELFLDNKIGFTDIADLIEKAMSKHKIEVNYDIDDIIKIDKSARECIYELVGR